MFRFCQVLFLQQKRLKKEHSLNACLTVKETIISIAKCLVISIALSLTMYVKAVGRVGDATRFIFQMVRGIKILKHIVISKLV